MTYDLIIIGSGPGGYVAAIRAGQLGMKTAIIEKYATLGGTCLNVGCIPSKALLDSSEHYHNAAHTFVNHGIELTDLKVDLAKMVGRKEEVVKQNVDGIQYLMKKNKVDVLHGKGSFVDKIPLKSPKMTAALRKSPEPISLLQPVPNPLPCPLSIWTRTGSSLQQKL